MKVKRRPLKPVRIEMLPLIDIVFLLLVFFIYAMLSMAVHSGLRLDLPESSQAAPSKESPLTLSVKKGTPDIEIYVNKNKILLEELSSYLEIKYEEKGIADEVLVFADESISYQQLFMVLDAVKKSGVKGISLQANAE